MRPYTSYTVYDLSAAHFGGYEVFLLRIPYIFMGLSPLLGCWSRGDFLFYRRGIYE
jgi:uncharacterized membrane protein YuzA (DUF378 family)